MKDFEIQKLIKRAWFQLITGVIISLFIIIFAIKIVQEDLFNYVIDEVDLQHEVVTSLVSKFKEDKTVFLNMLHSSEELREYLTQKKDKSEITKLFYNSVKSQKNIMQLRYIDNSGNEIVRIDQSKDAKIKIVDDDALQNKINRYYFKNFSKLSSGEVGYSDFDLNIEHEVVEEPYNPTLRMGRAVYHDGELVGILVVNFFMQDWIENILNFTHVKIAIINNQGDFMMHYDPEWAWSGYSKLSKKAIDYPLIDSIPNYLVERKPFYELSDYFIAKNIKLFSDDVLIAYKLAKPLNTLIFEKVLELSLVFLFSFFMILLPMFYLIYRYVQLTQQNTLFLNNILNNMFDALIVIDKNANIKHINQTTINLFGYSKEELVGQNIKLLVPEPHKKDHDSYVQNYDKEQRTIIGTHRNLNAIHKDKREIPISLAVTKIVLNDKVYFIGTVRDMSKIKALEDIAKEQEAFILYQSKLASMGEMVGAIAHQWRQPLNEITIRIQKLKYDFAKEKIDAAFIETFIEKNKTTIEFMSRTIDNFRGFFRVDKLKQNFFVKESVDSVVNMLNAQLKNHHIEVEVIGDDFTFNGFKTEFQQVVMNLLGNAKDAFLSNNTKEPKIKIEVKNYKVLIEDNAGGIAEEIIEKVFEPYFTTKDQGEGTGMGLYMSKMIIEKNMNSKIFMTNTKEGILVTIEFQGQNNA